MAWSGTDGEFEEFIDRHGLTFPQISDDAAVVYERFEIAVQPALVVVDSSGDVETILGSVDGARLDEVLGAAADR